jgi:hypothetical protein
LAEAGSFGDNNSYNTAKATNSHANVVTEADASSNGSHLSNYHATAVNGSTDTQP